MGRYVKNPSGTVVEWVDCDWTMVLHRVGVWEGFEAAPIAQQIKTRIIAYEAENTSGSSVCSDIDQEGVVTRLQDTEAVETEADFYESMSEYADELGEDIFVPAPAEIIDNYDDYLTQQGIRLINLGFNADLSTAIVEPEQKQHVGRVIQVGNMT